jgi:multiple sugar transport system permease protein
MRHGRSGAKTAAVSHATGITFLPSVGRRRGRETLTGWLFVAPAIILLGLFTLYPLAHSLWLSLHERHLFDREGTWVGLGNFAALIQSSDFWVAFWNGVIFAGATVTLQLLTGIATALLLHNHFRGRALVRGVILFPFVVPTIVAVLIWKWMLNDLYGVLNIWLMALGVVDTPVLWLASPKLAMATVIAINVWLFFPFITIHVLARLQVIPLDVYESARVDGAGRVQRFWYITLPQLRSTILLVVLIRGIWMFNKFDSIWLLTEGGPLDSTQTLPLLAYLKAFGQYQLGMGAAVAACIFLILAASTVWYGRLMRDESLA